jgi:hypothetical protein
LKEQLRASKANAGKSTQEVYRMQAAKFNKQPPTSAESWTKEEAQEQAALHRKAEESLLASLDDITPINKDQT